MNYTAVVPADGPTLLEADLVPDDVASWAARTVPGSAVIGPLARLDPGRLSHAARVDALVALARQQAWLAAAQLRLLAVMADDPAAVGSPSDELNKDWVREDVRCALRLSAVAADDELALARDLAHRLPSTLAALDVGQISVRHARALAEAVASLDDATARRVQDAVLGGAGGQTVAEFRRRVRRAVLAAEPATAAQRHERAVTDRRVALSAAQDGMRVLWALLPAEGAAALMTAVDAMAATAAPGDRRAADQRRADALVQLGLDRLAGTCSDRLPRQQRLRPAVQVTIALSTLLSLDDQPGDLAGHGPIPAALARRLAADPTGTWRRLVTDDVGRLLDHGRRSYRPPADLARHVIARDRTCRFPTCSRAAHRCELDHIHDWREGGTTDPANLQVLCRRHHHAKHDAGWKPRREPDGSTRWTSPTGHEYRKPPSNYPVDRTLDPDPPPY